MKSKTFLPLLFFAIAIPQIVSAVWWNPLTWRKAEQINEVKKEVNPELESRIQELEQKLNDDQTNGITEEKIKSPEPQIITKTVQVDNPQQAKEIIELKQKLTEANETIKSLEIKIDNLTTTAIKNMESLGKQCDSAQEKIADTCKTYMQDLALQCRNTTYSSGIDTGALNQLIQNQNAQYQAQQEANINAICDDWQSRRYSQSTNDYCKSIGR